MEPHPVPGPMRRRDLPSVLLEPVLESGGGDRAAVRWSGGTWTHHDLWRAVGSVAGWLRRRGIGRGDLVLMSLIDGPDAIALFLGLGRVGAVAAPMSPDLPAGRASAAAARLDPWAVAAERPIPSDARRLPLDEMRDAIAAGVPDPGPAAVRGTDPSYLLLTSGSTGRSRWALHRVRDIPACVATYGRRVLRLRPDDVTWSIASLSTSYGLGNLLYFPLAAGASAAIADGGRTPADAAADCARHGVTALFGVPTSWARLARHVAGGRVPAGSLATVRLGVSAGEPLPPAVWWSVHGALGLRIVDGLGSSEASNLYLSARPGGARPGTVGWPVPGYEVRTRRLPGMDDPREGELLVRGPTVMEGYAGEDGTGPVDAEGWLATGDIVRREPDGCYRFLARRGDRFKSRGFWVDPRRVADALGRGEAVRAVAVLPVRDADGLLRVGAAVAVDGDPGRFDGDTLVAAAAERLAPHEVPRALLVFDALPTAASGKVDRAELSRLLGRRIAEPVA